MWWEIVHNMESNSKESNLYACDSNVSFHKAWGDTRIDFCLTKGAELGLRKAQKERCWVVNFNIKYQDVSRQFFY